MSAKLAQGPGKCLGEKLMRLLLREPKPQQAPPITRPQTAPRPQPGQDPKRPVATPLPGEDAQTDTPQPNEDATPEEEAQPEEEEKEDEDVCCDPYQFRYHWPIATKPAPRPHAGLKPNKRRERMFQRWTCGAREYHCSGGGKTAWADGLQPEICYMKDAKWNEKKSSPYVLGTAQDFLIDRAYPEIYKQFDKYGEICRDPDPPCTECWGVGLLVVVNTPDTVPFFNALCYMTIPDGRWRVDIQTMPKSIIEEMHDKYSDGIDAHDDVIRDIFNDPINHNIRKNLGK